MIKSCTKMAHLHLPPPPKWLFFFFFFKEIQHFPTVSTVNYKVYKTYLNHGRLYPTGRLSSGLSSLFFPTRTALPSANTLHIHTASLPPLRTSIHHAAPPNWSRFGDR